MPDGALNPKQQRFVEEYLVDLNATQAAIRSGYSRKTAESQGSRLLSNAKVKAAVEEGRAKQSRRTEINADWLLRRLAEEAEADFADLYDDRGELKPVREWPAIWRKGLVAGLETDETREDGVLKATTRKLKISDRLKRLELIGRHIAVGAFVDKHEHTGKDGQPLVPETPDPVDLAKRVAFLLSSAIQS
jgi:phage terminase small subunit